MARHSGENLEYVPTTPLLTFHTYKEFLGPNLKVVQVSGKVLFLNGKVRVLFRKGRGRQEQKEKEQEEVHW